MEDEIMEDVVEIGPALGRGPAGQRQFPDRIPSMDAFNEMVQSVDDVERDNILFGALCILRGSHVLKKLLTRRVNTHEYSLVHIYTNWGTEIFNQAAAAAAAAAAEDLVGPEIVQNEIEEPQLDEHVLPNQNDVPNNEHVLSNQNDVVPEILNQAAAAEAAAAAAAAAEDLVGPEIVQNEIEEPRLDEHVLPNQNDVPNNEHVLSNQNDVVPEILNQAAAAEAAAAAAAAAEDLVGPEIVQNEIEKPRLDEHVLPNQNDVPNNEHVLSNQNDFASGPGTSASDPTMHTDVDGIWHSSDCHKLFNRFFETVKTHVKSYRKTDLHRSDYALSLMLEKLLEEGYNTKVLSTKELCDYARAKVNDDNEVSIAKLRLCTMVLPPFTVRETEDDSGIYLRYSPSDEFLSEDLLAAQELWDKRGIRLEWDKRGIRSESLEHEVSS